MIVGRSVMVLWLACRIIRRCEGWWVICGIFPEVSLTRAVPGLSQPLASRGAIFAVERHNRRKANKQKKCLIFLSFLVAPASCSQKSTTPEFSESRNEVFGVQLWVFWQDKAKQGKGRQGKARQGKARQGRSKAARQDGRARNIGQVGGACCYLLE